jgi:hypothetical protein
VGRRIRKGNRQGEFDKSTLYICMEVSLQNPFIQLTYTDAKKDGVLYKME